MTKITTDAQALAVFDALVLLMNQGHIGVRSVDEARAHLTARLASTSPAPDGWVLVPRSFSISPEAWEAASFAYGGPATGAGEPYYDCTAWVGEIEGDDGDKTWGLHISCDECPEEGSITLAEFDAAPQPVVEKDNG